MSRSFTAANLQYLSNAAAVVTNYPFTVAGWFYTAELAAHKTLLSINNSTNKDSYSLQARSNEVVSAAVSSGPGVATASTTTTWSANVWNHAAGVFTASNNRAAFLNGGGKGTNSTNISVVGPNETEIGRRGFNGAYGSYMDGRLAELAVWDVALSDAEIAILASSISPPLVRPGNIIAYWPLIGRTSPEIDPVGKLDMTLQAAPPPSAHPRIYMPSGGVYVPATATIGGGGGGGGGVLFPYRVLRRRQFIAMA